MLHNLLQRWSFLRVSFQNLIDKVLRFIRDKFRKLILNNLNILFGFSLILILKWRSATNKFISKDCNRPDIDSFSIFLSIKVFRSQVVKCTAKCISSVVWTVSTPSKIRYFYYSMTVQKILWFYVSMNYIFLMHVINALKHLPYILSWFLLTEFEFWRIF